MPEPHPILSRDSERRVERREYLLFFFDTLSENPPSDEQKFTRRLENSAVLVENSKRRVDFSGKPRSESTPLSYSRIYSLQSVRRMSPLRR